MFRDFTVISLGLGLYAHGFNFCAKSIDGGLWRSFLNASKPTRRCHLARKCTMNIYICPNIEIYTFTWYRYDLWSLLDRCILEASDFLDLGGKQPNFSRTRASLGKTSFESLARSCRISLRYSIKLADGNSRKFSSADYGGMGSAKVAVLQFRDSVHKIDTQFDVTKVKERLLKGEGPPTCCGGSICKSPAPEGQKGLAGQPWTHNERQAQSRAIVLYSQPAVCGQVWCLVGHLYRIYCFWIHRTHVFMHFSLSLYIYIYAYMFRERERERERETGQNRILAHSQFVARDVPKIDQDPSVIQELSEISEVKQSRQFWTDFALRIPA